MFGSRSRGYLGIDLGERAIKIAQLRRVGAGLQLSAAAITPRPPGDGGLIEGVEAACTLAGGVGASAAVVLSMNRCEVTPASDLSEAQAAGDPERCRDAWGDPPNAYVLDTVRSEVEAIVDRLAKNGLQCEVVDGAPLALARATQLTAGLDRDEPVGVLDWGDRRPTFLAAKGGVALYTRRLASDGLAAIRSSLATTLALSETDAERALLRYGVAADGDSPESRVVGDTVRRAMRPVVSEVRRTLEHLGGKLKRRPPQRLLVTGAAGAVPGLAARLGQELELDAAAWQADALSRASDVVSMPDCLLAPAIAASALAWEAPS